MVRIHRHGPLETRRRFSEPLGAEELVAFFDEGVSCGLTHAPGVARESCAMTPRMPAAVGADVEALCSKCGDVWHVVVAKVGEQIVKVQCKQCGGYHRYKSPHGAPKEKRMPSPFAPRPERTPKAPVERFEKPAVAADLTR